MTGHLFSKIRAYLKLNIFEKESLCFSLCVSSIMSITSEVHMRKQNLKYAGAFRERKLTGCTIMFCPNDFRVRVFILNKQTKMFRSDPAISF